MTFMDLTQQLMCLFVLLVSVSSQDAVKLSMFERGWLHRTGAPRPVQVPRNMVLEMCEAYPDIGKGNGGVDVIGATGTHFRVQRIHEGLQIVLEDAPMFAEGSAELEPEARKQIQWLIDLAKGKMNYIDVRGFTGTTPAESEGGNHWILGYRRAESVALAMMGQKPDYVIVPGRIRISSRGNFDPLVPHDLPDQKQVARNRRVEIVISDLLWEAGK